MGAFWNQLDYYQNVILYNTAHVEGQNHIQTIIIGDGDKVIDQVGNQIQVLIDNAYETAQKILLSNMDILDRVAQCLLEKEKITSEEFEEFFKG